MYLSDPYHMITTGGEGHFYWKTAEAASDYNLNGQAGEDFDLDLTLPNIDFGTYHLYPQSWYPSQDYPGSNFTIEAWDKDWILDHASGVILFVIWIFTSSAAKKANKPVILEEFGVTGLANKTEIYPSWIELALSEDQAILPWQFGALGLTENGGNKIFKYADALINGVCELRILISGYWIKSLIGVPQRWYMQYQRCAWVLTYIMNRLRNLQEPDGSL
ncbi:hypothetical protein C0989_002225 [Termitomyces sp. Mn162]|nr:hypothetical protein C0989_002225 [Termitomyces sp. Mn162]